MSVRWEERGVGQAGQWSSVPVTCGMFPVSEAHNFGHVQSQRQVASFPGLHAQLLSLAVLQATKAGHGGLGTRPSGMHAVALSECNVRNSLLILSRSLCGHSDW